MDQIRIQTLYPWIWIWILISGSGSVMSGSGSDRIGSDPRIQINLADILLFDQLFLDHYLIYDPYLSENILQLLIYIRSGSTDQVRIGSSSDPDKRIRIQHWICIWTDLKKSGSIGSQATRSGSNPDPDPDLLILVVSTTGTPAVCSSLGLISPLHIRISITQ